MTLADELREEGREEGRIEESVKVLSEMSVPHNEIIEFLVERFNITEEQAEAYYKKFKP